MDPARLLANRYRLEAVIGRGGMGIVHRAVDQELERAVAVKLLSEGQSEAALVRFLAEAKRTAAVRHPSIVEVFDVGRDGDEAFLVMELLEGDTLDARLKVGGEALLPTEVLAIAAPICDALAAAHEAGLVHRDLKPANVFLVRSADGAPRVKLLDFGIAKRIDGATVRTDPSVIVGTLEYLSPEQITGGEIDGRADLYSLGMTLYHALTGELPFSGDNAAAYIHQHLSVVPRSLRERKNGAAIPAALDAVVLRLLAKDPKARPASAREAKRLLLAALSGEAEATAPHERPAGTSRGSEREIDFDDSASVPAADLELDHGTSPPRVSQAVPRGPEIVPVAVPVPLAVVTPPPGPLVTPLPSWLEPLASFPTNVSKRVAGYALFAFALNVVFFSGSFVTSVVFLVLAALGGISYWARRRSTPPE